MHKPDTKVIFALECLAKSAISISFIKINTVMLPYVSCQIFLTFTTLNSDVSCFENDVDPDQLALTENKFPFKNIYPAMDVILPSIHP